jgi:hypothetical protein
MVSRLGISSDLITTFVLIWQSHVSMSWHPIIFYGHHFSPPGHRRHYASSIAIVADPVELFLAGVQQPPKEA